jgi:hypothetical protein
MDSGTSARDDPNAVYSLGHNPSESSRLQRLGLANESELDKLFADALVHLDDPDVIVMPSVNFLVSGRKRPDH